jgi:sulfate permease, SulP family
VGTRGPGARQPLHLFRGFWPLQRGAIAGDVVAGITLAALAIPEVMGYTRISQTPVITGLYTLLIPVLAFAVFGFSRHLVVAADSATAAILAATLLPVAAPGSPEYVALTSLVALVVGGLLVLANLLRLGFLADFLSRSALIGLLSGIGVQVAAGEFGGLIGLEKQGQGAIEQVLSVLRRLGEARPLTLLLAVLVLAVIAAFRRLSPRLPGALIAVIAAIGASALLDFQHHGIAVVGTVPSGLPHLALPSFPVERMDQVLITAASCFVVILAQSAATSRAYAQRHHERLDENVDLIGLAIANVGAAVSGSFVVNGSPTKTEMVDAAGGRSQLAHLTTAAIVVLVLLFFTGPLSLLPVVVLSTIVFVIGIKLIDLRGLRELYRLQPSEFVIAALTVVTVALLGVMPGIAMAVTLSLIEQVRHTYRPRTRLWYPDPAGDGWHTAPVAAGVFAAPGIVAYRFEANLFYANAEAFKAEVLNLIDQNAPQLKGLVIDASGIDDVDYSAAKTLLELSAEFQRRHLHPVFVVSSNELLKKLSRYGYPTQGKHYHTVKKAIRGLSAQLAQEADFPSKG